MDITEWLQIPAWSAAVVSTVIAWNASRRGNRKEDIAAGEIRMHEIAKSEDAHVLTEVHLNSLRLTKLEERDLHSADAIQSALATAIQPIIASLAMMGTKVDSMWELQMEAAKDAARILHHPEEGRQHIDALLDSFIEDTLTEEEEIQLRKYLVIIRDWEPGQDVGFPVYLGEQMAAAAILRAMRHMPVNSRLNKESPDAAAQEN